MGILNDLREHAQFEFCYDKGGIADVVTGNAPSSVVQPLVWGRNKRRRGLIFQGVGCIEYADTPGNRMDHTEMTWFAHLGKPLSDPSAAFTTLAAKQSGAGTSWSIYRSSSLVLLYDGVNARFLNAAFLKGSHCFGITLVNGGIGKVYADGELGGVLSGTNTIVGQNYPLHVGNDHFGAYPSISGISYFVGWNKALSDLEMREVFREMRNQVSPDRAFVRNELVSSSPVPPSQKPSLQLYWALDGSPGGSEVDRSGLGRNATATGTTKRAGLFGTEATAFRGAGDSYVARTGGYTEAIAGDSTHTVSFWVNCENLASNPIVLASSVADDYYIQLTNTRIQWRIGGSTKDFIIDLTAPGWKHIVLVKEGAGAPASSGYLNGRIINAMSGVHGLVPATAANLNVGLYTVGSAANALRGAMQKVKVFSSMLDASAIAKLYYDGARRLRFGMRMREDTEVTLANVTAAGGKLANTPFVAKTAGAFSVGELRPGQKFFRLAGDVDRYISAPNDRAYGTVVVDFYQPAGAAAGSLRSWWAPIVGAGSTPAALLGYSYIVLGADLYLTIQRGGANLTAFAGALTDATFYRLAMTRNEQHSFTTYLKGGAYLDWTQLTPTAGTNPVVNSTYTTSQEQWFSAYAVAEGQAWSAPTYLEGVLTLEQLKEKF